MEIKSLKNTSFDVIYSAFKEAFKDYEMQLTKEELNSMLKRRGFNPDFSFAAFENEKIISFTLNGIGYFNNVKTAYDTGTGTIKEYRGQGLATKIFEYSIPYLKQIEINQYLLEVLQHNTKAVSIYKNIGFNINREFYYFIKEIDKLDRIISDTKIPIEIKINTINNTKELNNFEDFYPSWQNNNEAIIRDNQNFITLCAYHQNSIIGYCIIEPKSGDITQIATNKKFRRKGVASKLFEEALKLNKYHSIKIVNTDLNCKSITKFLESKNILPKGKQFEMIKKM